MSRTNLIGALAVLLIISLTTPAMAGPPEEQLAKIEELVAAEQYAEAKRVVDALLVIYEDDATLAAYQSSLADLVEDGADTAKPAAAESAKPAAAREQTPAAADRPAGTGEALTLADKVAIRTLQSIGQDMIAATEAGDTDARNAAATEYLMQSAGLLRDRPQLTNVWAGRALAAASIGHLDAGWEAGQYLQESGSTSEPALSALAELKRRGWLNDQYEELRQKKLRTELEQWVGKWTGSNRHAYTDTNSWRTDYTLTHKATLEVKPIADTPFLKASLHSSQLTRSKDYRSDYRGNEFVDQQSIIEIADIPGLEKIGGDPSLRYSNVSFTAKPRHPGWRVFITQVKPAAASSKPKSISLPMYLSPLDGQLYIGHNELSGFGIYHKAINHLPQSFREFGRPSQRDIQILKTHSTGDSWVGGARIVSLTRTETYPALVRNTQFKLPQSRLAVPNLIQTAKVAMAEGRSDQAEILLRQAKEHLDAKLDPMLVGIDVDAVQREVKALRGQINAKAVDGLLARSQSLMLAGNWEKAGAELTKTESLLTPGSDPSQAGRLASLQREYKVATLQRDARAALAADKIEQAKELTVAWGVLAPSDPAVRAMVTRIDARVAVIAEAERQRRERLGQMGILLATPIGERGGPTREEAVKLAGAYLDGANPTRDAIDKALDRLDQPEATRGELGSTIRAIRQWRQLKPKLKTVTNLKVMRPWTPIRTATIRSRRGVAFGSRYHLIRAYDDLERELVFTTDEMRAENATAAQLSKMDDEFIKGWKERRQAFEEARAANLKFKPEFDSVLSLDKLNALSEVTPPYSEALKLPSITDKPVFEEVYFHDGFEHEKDNWDEQKKRHIQTLIKQLN